MSDGTSPPPQLQLHRRGYTLVEMLLATALCGVLLAALWMLMSTYGELFDKGQQQVERAQLCRALLQQMADDLRMRDPRPAAGHDQRGGRRGATPPVRAVRIIARTAI